MMQPRVLSPSSPILEMGTLRYFISTQCHPPLNWSTYGCFVSYSLIRVSLRYEDLRSEFPTKVEVKQETRQVSGDRRNLVIEEERLLDKEDSFYHLRLTPAFISAFGEA